MSTGEATPPDDELVRRAQAGDQGALRVLFDRHGERLRNRIRRRLPTLARVKVAESDVIQEAYLAAFRRLADFEDRGDGAFEGWLRRIVDNKIRDAIRRHLGTTKRAAGREEKPPGESAFHLIDPHRSPGSEVAAADDRRVVRAALQTLAGADQEILRLVHESTLTFPEAGARLGITADAARMRYGRALSRIALQLGAVRP